ncbi:aldehyde dehydrogenase family protein, partial [Rhizobium ruizarguesonis]
MRPGVAVAVLREPEGVIGIITPWHFPLALPSCPLSPSLSSFPPFFFPPSSLFPFFFFS